MRPSPNLSKFHSGTNNQKIELLKNFNINGAIADVGCGNGLYALLVSSHCSDILQIDVLDRRDTRAKDFAFLEADIEQFEFTPDSLNSIIAFDIIEHLDDDVAFIKNAFNGLKTEGRIFISVPNEDNSKLETMSLAHVHFTDKTHRREYSAKSLRSLLEENGFKVLHIEPHINNDISSITKIFAKDNIISRILAKLISLQIRIFEKTSLFENNIVSDWFIVGEKNDTEQTT